MLVLTATTSEADAVLDALPPADAVRIGPYDALRSTGRGEVSVLAGGIGPAAAAAATATALALRPDLDLVLNVGIAGGFAAAGARVGDVVVATESGFGDLGADSPEGFLDSASLDWGHVSVAAEPALVRAVRQSMTLAGLAVHTGVVLTLSTVTGTAARGVELFAASQPVAEAMEGAAAGSVAARFSRAFLEVRTVSNLVGVRDRAGWDIPQATSMLTRAVSAMIPVLVIAP